MSIAAEWDAQTNKRMGIQPVNMPMMSIASTAIDQIQVDRTHAVDTCMRYLPTDTALFHAPDYDRILQAQQKKHFLPVLEWAQKEFDINLATSQSMAGRIEHPEIAYTKLRSILEKMVRNKPHKLPAWQFFPNTTVCLFFSVGLLHPYVRTRRNTGVQIYSPVPRFHL